MLVPIPIGLWVFSLICDLIHAGGSTNPAWTTVAFYTMGAGIIGALAAAIFGLIDLISLPADPRRTALAHMALNLTIVVLYLINFGMRWSDPENPGGAVWLSVIAIILLVISGWLGGKLVYVLGVAVESQPTTTTRR
jgi:uncharacterized membrane protein